MIRLCLYHRRPHSCPTRRSSDLTTSPATNGVPREPGLALMKTSQSSPIIPSHVRNVRRDDRRGLARLQDRKSTRLNSSHLVISYAVFCSKTRKYQKI